MAITWSMCQETVRPPAAQEPRDWLRDKAVDEWRLLIERHCDYEAARNTEFHKRILRVTPILGTQHDNSIDLECATGPWRSADSNTGVLRPSSGLVLPEP